MEDTQYNLNTRIARAAQVDYENYRAAHNRKPFDRVPYEIIVRLGEDHGGSDICLNVYEYQDNLNKTVLNQTCDIGVCSLTIDDSLLANYDPGALFVQISCANSSIIGTPYQFKLVSIANGIPNKRTFRADTRSFTPFAPFKLDRGYIRISDIAGPISFESPYGRTTAASGLLGLTTPTPIVGDIIVIKKVRGTVTAVNVADFTVSITVPDGPVSFYLPRYDLDLHIKAVGLVPY